MNIEKLSSYKLSEWSFLIVKTHSGNKWKGVFHQIRKKENLIILKKAHRIDNENDRIIEFLQIDINKIYEIDFEGYKGHLYRRNPYNASEIKRIKSLKDLENVRIEIRKYGINIGKKEYILIDFNDTCYICGGRGRIEDPTGEGHMGDSRCSCKETGFLRYTYKIFSDGSIKRSNTEPKIGCLGVIVSLVLFIIMVIFN